MMTNGGTTSAGLIVEPNAGGAPSLQIAGSLVGAVPTNLCEYRGGFVTVDMAGNVWTDKVDQQNLINGNAICQFSPSGQLIYYYQTLGILNGNFFFPEQLATDRGNNLWFTDKNTNTVGSIASGQGSFLVPVVNLGVTLLTAPAGGKLNNPRGVAVDGANTIWVSNNGNGSIAHVDDSTNGLSPSFYGGGFTYTDPRTGASASINDLNFVSVDQSGNVWAGGSNSGQTIQFVGLAAPTVNPLSEAKKNAMVGVQP